jgi:hypothetical protein
MAVLRLSQALSLISDLSPSLCFLLQDSTVILSSSFLHSHTQSLFPTFLLEASMNTRYLWLFLTISDVSLFHSFVRLVFVFALRLKPLLPWLWSSDFLYLRIFQVHATHSLQSPPLFEALMAIVYV